MVLLHMDFISGVDGILSYGSLDAATAWAEGHGSGGHGEQDLCRRREDEDEDWNGGSTVCSDNDLGKDKKFERRS